MASNRGPRRPGDATFGRSQQWLRLAAVLLVLALGAYGSWQQRWPAPQPEDRGTPPAQAPATNDSVRPAALPEASPDKEKPADARAPLPSPAPPPARGRLDGESTRSSPAQLAQELRTTIANQTIRDLNGRVVYRGDVDVSETLARIDAGERLPFPNDGSTFQNRERRLPRQRAGYYREYVHPTPGLRGPGPQRIVIGDGGEAYYTADHYESFVRLDAP